MSELEPQKQNNFMIEKIKERPINKRKLLRRTLLTAAMAVIFGLIACFTFLVLEPVLNNWLHPKEESHAVTFPEDLQEMLPADMLEDNIHQDNTELSDTESMALEKEQIEEILSGVKLDLDNYIHLYTRIAAYVEDLVPYLVTFTGITSYVYWFQNVQ